MKNLILTTLLVLAGMEAWGQGNTPAKYPIDVYLDRLYPKASYDTTEAALRRFEKITRSYSMILPQTTEAATLRRATKKKGYLTDRTGPLFFSEPTVNRLFAKRVAHYLSGSNDLSLYRNFATVNTKGFSIGNTFSFPNNPFESIKCIANAGVRMPFNNNQGAIFQNSKFQQGITGFFNVAILGDGEVRYSDIKDAVYMNDVRGFLRETTDRKVAQERADFSRIYKSPPTSYTTLVTKRETEFEQRIDKKYHAEYADEEESYGIERFNSLRKHWIVIMGDVPVSALEYRVLEPGSKRTRTILYRPFVLGLQYGKFVEGKDVGWLFTVDAKIRNDDVLRFYNYYKANITKDSVAAFGRSLGIGKISGDTTFLDKRYQNIGTFIFSPRLYISFPKAGLSITRDVMLFNGLAFNLSTQTIYNQLFSYTNVNVGTIFGLSGRDSKPINIELVLTANDVFNQLTPPESKSSRVTLTASLAIPLNSLIF